MDGIVGVRESFQALETGLAVVEGGRADVKLYVRLRDKLHFTPFTILVGQLNVRLGWAELHKREEGGHDTIVLAAVPCTD